MANLLAANLSYVDWREELTESLEVHDYDEPAVATEPVAAWYAAVARLYPPQTEDHEGSRYFVGESGVHVAFREEADAFSVGVAEKWARRFGLGYQLFTHPQWAILVPDGAGGYDALYTVHPEKLGPLVAD